MIKWVLLVIFVILLVGCQQKKEVNPIDNLIESIPKQPVKIIDMKEWKQTYADNLDKYNIYDKDLESSSVIDHTNDKIVKIASQIELESETADQALHRVLNYVLSHIVYDSTSLTIDGCYDETSVTVLENKYGDCVSMTKLGTALLRHMGFVVKTAGGCLRSIPTCYPLMQVIPIYVETRKIRSLTFDMKKRGYLHEWAEVFIDGQWWTVDFTSGGVYGPECRDYLLYSYDKGDKEEMCVINDESFFEKCKTI